MPARSWSYLLILVLVALGVGLTFSSCAKKSAVNTVAENQDEPAADTAKAAEVAQPAELKPAFNITTRPPGPPVDDYAAYLAYMKANTKHEEKYLKLRWDRGQKARQHFVPADITIDRIAAAFLRTPREHFCRPANLSRVYDYSYQDIGWGQTISGPYIVARMTNAINPGPNDRVLEIGTGSGYQSAFLAELTNFVFTIEIIKPLGEETDQIYRSLEADNPQYKNIKRKIADGYYGWEEYAPFDKIIVTCGIDHIPPPLLQQLAVGGIMVIPVGPPSMQQILKITKFKDAEGFVTLKKEDLYQGTGLDGDIFVPFTNDQGQRHSKELDKVAD